MPKLSPRCNKVTTVFWCTQQKTRCAIGAPGSIWRVEVCWLKDFERFFRFTSGDDDACSRSHRRTRYTHCTLHTHHIHHKNRNGGGSHSIRNT